jgi:predicted ATPase
MAALDSLTLRGFKSILNLEKFKLGKMNLLIGANGSGKSNFVSFFTLLNNLIEGQLACYVADQGGPDRFLHRGREVSPSLEAVLEFGYNEYGVELKPTTDNRFFFEKEILSFTGRLGPYGEVFPTERSLGNGYFESKAKEQLHNDYNKKITGYVVPAILSWRVYHFHDTSDQAKVKRIHAINENVQLASDAGNLAAFLLRLREESRAHYDRIRETVSLVAPCFDDFVLRPSGKNQDSIQLEWKAKGVSGSQPFLAHHLSDGTIRFICLATLLMNPMRPSTIIIDEPELGLHPYAVKILASLLDEAAQRTQLIVATQCAQLVDEMESEDVIITSMEDGVSKFERLDPEKLKPWLEDYSLSELWNKNVVGGRP